MLFGSPYRRIASYHSSFRDCRRLTYLSSNPLMSLIEPQSDLHLNLSLPTKPAPSLASRITPILAGPSSLPKLNHALPPRPTANPPSASFPSTNPRGLRSPSPLPAIRERDVYRPSSPPRIRYFDDVYVPSPSPPPRRYRSPTPPRRRYSPSPVRRRHSLSPIKRRRSPSPSPSPSVSREEVEPLPKQTFFTHSHRKEEALEKKRQRIEEINEAKQKAREEQEEARERAKNEHQEAREVARKEERLQWNEYQDRRAELDAQFDRPS